MSVSESASGKKYKSLELQLNRIPLELSPKDVPAEVETVKGSRQRRAVRLKMKPAEVETSIFPVELSPEDSEQDAKAVEQRTMLELENTIMMKDLET